MVITLFLILKTGTQNWTPYLIIQTQEARIREEVDRKYQHIVDSIKCDMDILKHNKVK